MRRRPPLSSQLPGPLPTASAFTEIASPRSTASANQPAGGGCRDEGEGGSFLSMVPS